MTKKDYKLISSAIKRMYDSSLRTTEGMKRISGLRISVLSIAQAMQSDNERFNPKKFTEACGMHFTNDELEAWCPTKQLTLEM